MTTWEPMPAVVWDKDGNKWVYELSDYVWKSNEFCASTVDLLEKHGPVTDTRPIKVGDAVSLEDIRALLAEVKRLQAQIDAVKALHCQDAVQPRYCAECSDFGTDQFPAGELIEWPCPTLLAFHGDKAFDRWLDQHDREVAAKALREAADAMDADPGFRDPLRLHSDWLRTLSGKSEAKQ